MKNGFKNWQQGKKLKLELKIRTIKLSKAQLSKISQSGRFFGDMIDKLGKKALIKLMFLWLKMLYHN